MILRFALETNVPSRRSAQASVGRQEAESLPNPPGLASNEEKETREISRNP